MPSGYTADIYDDKGITFPEFAMQCAREFGALIEMRDEAPGATIPDSFEPSSHYSDNLIKASEEFKRLTAMTDEQADAEANREADAWEVDTAERDAKREALKARYVDMLFQVQQWQPPTDDHKELKSFMIKQLSESIAFDCSEYKTPAPPRDGAEWRRGKIERELWDMKYYAEQSEQATTRAAERTAWIKALRNSLKDNE